MRDRAGDQPSESHVLWCADDEERGASGLPDQDGPGIALGELEEPVRARVDLVEHPGDARSIDVLDPFGGQVTRLRRVGDSERPAEGMHRSQLRPCPFRVACRPSQGLAG